MSVFDCNCFVGTPSTATLGLDSSAGGLLREMDRVGIDEALVCHVAAKEGHPLTGNEAILAETSGNDRLHPCWALLPPASGEMPSPHRIVDDMKASGVKAARIFPVSQLSPFTLLNFGELLEALEEESIPLLVDYEMTHWAEDPVDWQEVVRVGNRFPRLPLIVMGHSLRMPRSAYSAMQEMPNLRFETSYFQIHRGLEEVTRRFGSSRLLFGTGYPYSDPGPPLAMLELSGLGGGEKQRIAGDNLRSLIGSPIREAAPVPVPVHGFKVFDAHGHLGLWYRSAVARGSPEEMVRSMDGYGIGSVVVSHCDAISFDWKGGNTKTAEAAQAFPGRIYGYAAANPNYAEEIPAELERCFNRGGFLGIKFHCDHHRYPVEGSGYVPAFEFADSHGLPILIHGCKGRDVMGPILKKYSRTKILAAHAGGWDGHAVSEVIEMAGEYDNLYLDLSCSVVYAGALERMVGIAGSEKIVHGSDVPILDAAYQMGRVLHARLGDEQKQAILGDNARSLFGLGL